MEENFLLFWLQVLCLSVWFWDTVQFQELFLSHRSFLVNSDAMKTCFITVKATGGSAGL